MTTLFPQVNILSSIFDWLSASQNPFIQKFVAVGSDETVENAGVADEDRFGRAMSIMPSQSQLLDLLSGVYTAINKYENL